MAGPAAVPLLILTAATTAVAAYGSYQAGKAQKYEYERQAEQEKLAAQDRQIERRNRLLAALAQRTVGAAAFGSTLEGSPAALIRSDVHEYNLESLSSDAGVTSQISGLRAAGRNAGRAGTINAVGNLLSGGADLARIGKPVKT